MLPLPTRFAGIILMFAPLFVHRSWRHAQNLLVGALLTPGQRAVTSVLRIMSRAQERRSVNVHCILNRLRYQPGSGLARWFAERVGTGRGRIRKITAVARKLLVAPWRYLTTGLVPECVRLKAA